MGDDYPLQEVGAMDMSSELANQAAAEAVAAAMSASVDGVEDVGGVDGVSRVGGVEDGVNVADVGIDVGHVGNEVDVQGVEGVSADVGDGDVLSTPLPLLRAPYRQRNIVPPPFQFGAPHRQAPDSPLTNSQQLAVLREFYARNPNPGKKDLEILAEKTGRPWAKIREYFRQRRNKLRGLVDLENMEEPGRASGWLQVTYRAGPSTAVVSQLALYNSYKVRFDPYVSVSPLLAGQELIQLACATYPGCEMARDEGDYVLRGLVEKDAPAPEAEWDRGVDALVEPLRGTTWLLSSYQHQADAAAPPSVSQTEIYSAYAARFSALLPEGDTDADAEAELKEFEANMAADEPEMDDINSFLPPPPDDEQTEHTPHETPRETPPPRENRLLNPVELITLVKMTFPKSEAMIDESGRFVIRGLERREGIEKGRSGVKANDMFPFALANHPSPSDPTHPFTSLLKRKLQLLSPEREPEPKRRSTSIGVNIPLSVADDELGPEDRELLEGLARFRNSRLGREVRDTCVQQ